jgi:hypothetical protein
MKQLALTITLLFMATSALGADIDGKWSGQYNSGMGDPMTLVFTFKADGDTLTGTSLGGPDTQIPIRDGKINGNNISFVVAVDFNGQEMKFDYKGVLSSDRLELSFAMAGAPPAEGAAPQKFVVTRVK